MTKQQNRMFFGQFADFMIIVLIIAGIVSGLIGDLTDTIAIIVIVVLNAIIGFVQEYRTERALASLMRLASPTAQVLRESEIKTIAAQELVPGDLVMLEAGNVVPVDLKLLDLVRLNRLGQRIAYLFRQDGHVKAKPHACRSVLCRGCLKGMHRH